jgi:hypothetical protein
MHGLLYIHIRNNVISVALSMQVPISWFLIPFSIKKNQESLKKWLISEPELRKETYKKSLEYLTMQKVKSD